MVLMASAVVLLGMLYSVAVEPAWTARARLLVEVPRLQEELIQIQAMRAEAQQLTGRSAGITSVNALRTAAEQAVLRANLVANVASAGDGSVSVTAENVPVQAWFAWLESFARESRVVVNSARVVRADSLGRVNAEVSFQTHAK